MGLCVYSLCSAEGHLEVLPAIDGAQRVVVEGFGKEIMDQRAKRHAVTPTGGEILNVHVLWGKRPTGKRVRIGVGGE